MRLKGIFAKNETLRLKLSLQDTNWNSMKNTKLYTLLFSLFAFGNGVMAQTAQAGKTIYLNSIMQVTAEGQSAFQLKLTPIENEHYKGSVYDAMENLKVDGKYIQRNGRYIEDGYFKYYFTNGQIESEGEYQAGVKVGYWKRYDFMGNRKPDRYYAPSSAAARRQALNLDISTDN